MQKYMTYTTIMLLIVNYCRSAEIDASEAEVVRAGVEIKKMMSKDMPHYVQFSLKKKQDHYRTTNRLSLEDDQVINTLLSESATTADCSEQVIQYLRRRYVNYSINYAEEKHLFSEKGICLSGLAEALFWLKDDPSGLYEYYRLARISPLSGQFLVDTSDDKKKDDMLSRFKLYMLIQNLKKPSLDRYVFGKPVRFQDGLENMVLLREGYQNCDVVGKFVLEYPFMAGSYFDVRQKFFQNEYSTVLPPIEQLLLDYYQRLFKLPKDQRLFLARVQKHFGKDSFVFLAKDILNNHESHIPSQLIDGLWKIAIESHAWEIVDEIVDQPELVASAQLSLNDISQIKREIETELEMVKALESKCNVMNYANFDY